MTPTTPGGGLGREELRERVARDVRAAVIDWNTLAFDARTDVAEFITDALLASGVLDAVRGEAWDEGVDAAFRGAVTRQNAADVKRGNPYRAALGERGER